MNEQAKQEPKRVEVTLAKPHKHQGVDYDAKAKIKVTEPERDWLIARNVVNGPKEGAK